MMLAVASEWIIWPMLCGIGFVLSALFSGLEIGAYVTNKVRVELHADTGSPQARILRRFFHNMDNLLVVILIGNNISNYLATFAVSVMFVMAGYGRNAEWMTLAVAAPVVFVFAEAVPKNIFQRRAERLVHLLARFLWTTDWLFRLTGISYLVRFVSWLLLKLIGRRDRPQGYMGHEGLAAVLAEGQAAGTLTADQRKMSERVMDIKKVRVADVMQPMDQVAAVPEALPREAFLERIREHDYSRMPMLDPAGQVTGVIDIYDVLTDTKDQPISVHCLSPLVIPADRAVTEALYTMQHACRSFAVAADAEGKHVGIMTIKDLVEEIVGELEAW
jgi:CBS domain containing-hemolysin-like protein